jgi:hypothetical protein
MKGRPFLAGLLVIALLALGTGWGGWWLVWQRGPLQLQHHTLTIPRAARFVPRHSPLSLYIFSDGEQPVDYARAVAPLRQREDAARTVERLRDGAFAAAGLNYHDELAQWLAPEVGVALLATPEEASGGSWLLALSSKDEDGARRFLQRFWQSRSLAGGGLQVSQYRGMGLISGRGALVGREPAPLATALVQDDLVLIASGRATLERALDVSQIEALNQAGLPPLKQGVERWGSGMALLVARSGAFGPWLGWPSLESNATPADGAGPLLVGTLQPLGRQLVFEGQLHLPQSPLPSADLAEARPDSASPWDRQVLPETPPSQDASASAKPPFVSPSSAFSDEEETEQRLLQDLRGEPTTLAILRNPAGWLAQPWLQPLVQGITNPPAAGPLPARIAAADPAVLLISTSPEGWLIGTRSQAPPTAALEAPLAAEGLIEAPLELEEETVTVWTQLVAADRQGAKGREREDLRATVAGWRRESDGLALWGGNLALRASRPGSRAALTRARQLDALGHPQAPLRWVLGEEAASALLQRWQPWTLLTTLAGGPLAPGLQSLAVAIEPDQTLVDWTVRLQFSEATHG